MDARPFASAGNENFHHLSAHDDAFIDGVTSRGAATCASGPCDDGQHYRDRQGAATQPHQMLQQLSYDGWPPRHEDVDHTKLRLTAATVAIVDTLIDVADSRHLGMLNGVVDAAFASSDARGADANGNHVGDGLRSANGQRRRRHHIAAVAITGLAAGFHGRHVIDEVVPSRRLLSRYCWLLLLQPSVGRHKFEAFARTRDPMLGSKRPPHSCC